MFLPHYSRSKKGWMICRVSPDNSVTPVLQAPDRQNCLAICKQLNQLTFELRQIAISHSWTHSKNATQIASDFCRKWQSKRSRSKAT